MNPESRLQPADILSALEARTGGRTWDQPPAVWAIRDHGGKPALQDVRMSPDLVGPMPHPVLILGLLAEDVQDHARRGLPPGHGLYSDSVHGIAVRSEGWGLPPGTLSEEEMIRALSVRGTITAHPDRVEIRSVHAVARDGTRYSVLRPRGAPEPDSHITPFDAPPHSVWYEGAVVDAAARLMYSVSDYSAIRRAHSGSAGPGSPQLAAGEGITVPVGPDGRRVLAAVVGAGRPVPVAAVCRSSRLSAREAFPLLDRFRLAGLIHDDTVIPPRTDPSPYTRQYQPSFAPEWYRRHGLLPSRPAAPEAEPG